MMFPSGIHGLIIQNGNSVFETLMTESTFGWEISLYPLIPGRKIWYEAHSIHIRKRKKRLVYLFNFSEADRVLCSNCFDAYRLPMITSFPGIPKSTELAMWRFVTQFYIGEYLRFTEEGIGIKSEQRAPMVTARFGGRESRYDLTTGGFRN